jgi:hypothetical protein
MFTVLIGWISTVIYYIVFIILVIFFLFYYLVIFLTVLTIRAIFPRTKRKRFWGSIVYTMCSPVFTVQFRDEIIGDVLTSLVRPIQDLVFAYVYYFTVLRYGVADAAQRCNESNNYFLHIWALPACALLPLWWRFLQCLRQSKDNNRRWPYYGNAFKYFIAAMVVLNDFGHVTTTIASSSGSSSSSAATKEEDPDTEWYNRTWWIISFLLATLYQIWWDVFFDWELFLITPPIVETSTSITATDDDSTIRNPSYSYLLSLWNKFRTKYIYLPGDQIALRPKRMYKSDNLYWGIFVLNCMFRFLWILSFIPAKHFSPSSGVMVNSFSSDVQSYVGPIIAGGEIIRRCMWGILRVESESIKLYNNSNDTTCNGEDKEKSGLVEIENKKDIIEGIVKLTTAETRLKSIEIASDGNNTQECISLKSSVCSCLECTRQLEPIAFVVLFILCGFRAVSS